MTTTMWILLGSMLLCVALSAFFSASETAYSALNKVKLKTMIADGNKKAQLALHLSNDYDRLLTTILIGNNVVNIAATALATVFFTNLLQDMGATVSTVVMTVVVLLFGETSPKSLAKEMPERIAIAVSRPIYILEKILKPLNLFFIGWRKLIGGLIKTPEDESYIEAELMTMVDEAENEGDMDEKQGELIRSAIEFNDQDAISILTPRVDMTAIEDIATMDEAADMFRESGYSRIPVYHEDLDHVVGILNEKDYYARKYAGCDDIRQIMTPPVWAPSTLKISQLLKLFQSSKTHMVILLDEFGGTEGLVTLEDVMEELVGEIYDEHDDVDEEMTLLEDGSYSVDGSMQLSEMLEELGVEDRFEADTVGGWASEMLGRIPSPGSNYEVDGLRCIVTEMEKRRVTRVRVWKLAAENEAVEENA